jgi:regulatory protein
LTGLDNKAKGYALKLLSYRGRSEKELRERLRRKGISETVITSVLKHLKQTGLVDDISLAEALKRAAIDTKMLSRAGAMLYVLGKGIPREIVTLVFGKDDTSDAENAGRFIDKRLRSLKDYPPEVVRRRLYKLLSRRGYSYETIKVALKNKHFREET